MYFSRWTCRLTVLVLWWQLEPFVCLLVVKPVFFFDSYNTLCGGYHYYIIPCAMPLHNHNPIHDEQHYLLLPPELSNLLIY